MDLGIQASLIAKVFVARNEEAAGLLVEGALREGNDQEALNYLEYVRQAPFLRVPIPLQRIDANVAGRLRDIRVKNLCQEVAFRRFLGKLIVYYQLASKDTASERRIIYIGRKNHKVSARTRT